MPPITIPANKFLWNREKRQDNQVNKLRESVESTISNLGLFWVFYTDVGRCCPSQINIGWLLKTCTIRILLCCYLHWQPVQQMPRTVHRLLKQKKWTWIIFEKLIQEEKRIAGILSISVELDWTPADEFKKRLKKQSYVTSVTKC